MPKLYLPPEASNYRVKPLPVSKMVALDGGRSKKRLDKINQAWEIQARWILNNSQYRYFIAFWETAISFGSEVFDLDVIINHPTAGEYEVIFDDDEWELVDQTGLRYTIEARLEGSPVVVDHSLNQDVIDAFEADPTVDIVGQGIGDPPLIPEPGSNPYTLNGSIPEQFNNITDIINLDLSGYFGTVGSPTPTFGAGGLPNGLSINDVTGVVTGTIQAPAFAYYVTISITGDGVPPAVQSFTWNVS